MAQLPKSGICSEPLGYERNGDVCVQKQAFSRFDIFQDGITCVFRHGIIILDLVFQVPAVLEERKQIIKVLGRVSIGTLNF